MTYYVNLDVIIFKEESKSFLTIYSSRYTFVALETWEAKTKGSVESMGSRLV